MQQHETPLLIRRLQSCPRAVSPSCETVNRGSPQGLSAPPLVSASETEPPACATSPRAETCALAESASSSRAASPPSAPLLPGSPISPWPWVALCNRIGKRRNLPKSLEFLARIPSTRPHGFSRNLVVRSISEILHCPGTRHPKIIYPFFSKSSLRPRRPGIPREDTSRLAEEEEGEETCRGGQ